MRRRWPHSTERLTLLSLHPRALEYRVTTMLTLRRGTRIACSALVLFALASATAHAQSRDLPRTAAGKPDMNGIWQALGNAHCCLLYTSDAADE